MNDTKRKGGRPRSGSLEWRGTTWYARLTVTVEGVSVRKWFDLGTDNKAVARRKRDRLVKEQSAPSAEALAELAKRDETFSEAARRIVKAQGEDGMRTHGERLRRLEVYAFPHIGDAPVTKIGPADIREVLSAAGKVLQRQSVAHVRNDMSSVFADLWRDEVIASNPVAKTLLPKGLKVDRRPRIIISDEGFARFMACPDVSEVLQLKAHCSRSFGGMRTSDLHAWDWSHFDLDTWTTAQVFRPKTDGIDEQAVELTELVIPDALRVQLHAYWTRQGRPRSGPVFPVLKGERAGERQRKRSHARELRAALWLAGVHLPLDGFDVAMAALRSAEAELAKAREAKAKGRIRTAQQAVRACLKAAQALDAIQANTQKTKRADFHSFRRQFNTALAAAGVNVQQAMALADHKDPRTHMRYVQLAQRGALEMPAAALPFLGVLPQGLPKLPGDSAVSNDDSASFQGDPSGNRTRVTGVRDAQNIADQASKQPDLSLGTESAVGAKTHQDNVSGQNRQPKISARNRAKSSLVSARKSRTLEARYG